MTARGRAPTSAGRPRGAAAIGLGGQSPARGAGHTAAGLLPSVIPAVQRGPRLFALPPFGHLRTHTAIGRQNALPGTAAGMVARTKMPEVPPQVEESQEKKMLSS